MLLRWRLLFLVIEVTLLHAATTGHHRERWKAKTNQMPCPGDHVTDVFVVFNAIGFVKDRKPVWRRLELVWHTANVQTSDQVSLYDADPALNPAAVPLLTISPADHPDSYFTTNVTVPTFNFSHAAPTAQCLGFYVTYCRDDVTIAASCLSSRPDWMTSQKADLMSRHLHEIMLPGTHDAASYRNYEGRKTDDNLFVRYASAQEESLLSQFYLGVRYFDARVAFYPNRQERFWVSHGVVPFRPFSLIVDDLIEMMSKTKEIVIFEIGGFEGQFSAHPEAYGEFLNITLPRLEQWMAPVPTTPHQHVLLGDLWASDRRLVLSWDADPAGHDSLWPRVPNTWHNDDTPEALYDTLRRSMSSAPRQELWSLAAEMTENAEDIILDRWDSLRAMADAVNRNVSRMVRYDWWDRTNIVQSDFFMSTYHVDTAVLVNWQRCHCG